MKLGAPEHTAVIISDSPAPDRLSQLDADEDQPEMAPWELDQITTIEQSAGQVRRYVATFTFCITFIHTYASHSSSFPPIILDLEISGPNETDIRPLNVHPRRDMDLQTDQYANLRRGTGRC